MKEKILLIDGSSLIFRAFFAIKNLTTKDGIATNGVYGFINMYRKAIDEVNPDYVCVAFDKSGPTFRNKDYEAYKGNRQKTPPELSAQFGILKDILDVMNVKHIAMDEFEADDILGTISKMAGKRGIESYMLTGDRDYFQLVSDNAKVLYTKKGISELEIYDKDKIFEKYGISPKEMIELKGLMGDSSDNIPGVPGVGEKTALKLVKEYGNIENIYENINNIKGNKLKENLEDNRIQAFLSRKLGTIITSVPLEYGIDDFRILSPDSKALYEKFKMLEFNSLIRDYEFEQVEVNHVYDLKFLDKADRILTDIKSRGEFVFDILIDNENYIENPPRFIAIKSSQDKAVLYRMDTDKDRFIVDFKGIFEDDTIVKIGFDIKKSIFLLASMGIGFEGRYIDLMVASYLIDPSRNKYTIDDLANIYLDKKVCSEEDYLGKGKAKKSYFALEDDKIREIFSNNLFVISDSREPILEKVDEMKMRNLLFAIELPLVRVLADMEIEGVLISKDELERQDEIISKKIDELEKEIYKAAGMEFNINSTKQLGEILFDKLNLPTIKKTKTGYSTDVEVLEKLRSSHEIVEYILEYRGLKKLKSTYIDGLYPYIMEDKRIRTIFRQTVTATGRISSTEPNLQNIPIRTLEGRLIRKAFICPEDSLLVSADYSQIELRVLAALSKDKNMIEAFKDGIDIHTKTASEVFHVGLDEVTKLQRSEAKAVNFGIVYGISDYGLSRDLNIPRKQAKDYIDKYLASYPQISSYMKEVVESAKLNGYVETIFNRRRYVPELTSPNFNIRSFGERIALNTPIQGSAADIIKVAMVKIYDRLKEEGLKSKLILQIHDELVIETKLDELETVKKLLVEEMENAVRLDVALVAEMEVGKTWYEV